MSLRNLLSWPSIANKTKRKNPGGHRAAARARGLRIEPLEERRLMVLSAAAGFADGVGPGAGYDGVVALAGCTGTLLWTGRHVLTAAHCVDSGDAPNGRDGNGIVNAGPWPDTFEWPVTFELPNLSSPITLLVSPDDITLHWLPGATDGWNGVHGQGSDIAIMELPELAPLAAERRAIYRGDNEMGPARISFLGYGAQNIPDPSGPTMVLNGSFGSTQGQVPTPMPPPPGPAKRIGYNHVDDADLRYAGSGDTPFDDNLLMDLDNPAGPTPGVAGEAIMAPGDSGGPLLIDNLIAGVASSQDAESVNPPVSRWGRICTYTRVSRFATWIDQTVDNDYDLEIDMRNHRSVGGHDGAADTITLSSAGNSLLFNVNGSTVFEEQHLDRIKSITIKGSGDDETIRIQSGSSIFALAVPITITGGGGTDTLTIDDSPIADAEAPHKVRFFSDRIERWSGGLGVIYNTVNFGDLDGLTYNGAQNSVTYDVYGSPWLNGGQTTINGSPNLSDTFTVYPRNFSGNPTILGRIGIFGGDLGGSQDDKIYIDDSWAELPGAVWTVNNPFGAHTQNFSVADGHLIGAYLDVEKVYLLGSSGDDTFNIESYKNGSALDVKGLGGSDTLNITPTSGNVSANITSMSSFAFDGGSDNDQFNVSNISNTNPWVYTRTSSHLQAQEMGTAYGGLILNNASVTWLQVLAGDQRDLFFVEETPIQTGNFTELNGGRGVDSYIIRPANGALNMQNIRGGVRVHGDGGDALVIDGRGDTVSRTLHVSPTRVGNASGDNLFGPGGYVEFLGPFVVLQVLTGAGTDIAHVQPNSTTPLEIAAGDPTTAPGDALFLNVAGVINPVLNEINSSIGIYTFDNRASVSYVGIEHHSTVVIEPDRDLDGVPDMVEDGAAGGDGNQDGILDSSQQHVASLPSVTGPYVTLVAAPGLALADVRAVSNPAPADAPPGIEFPLGFFNFRVLDLEPGEATNVTLILPEGAAMGSYWKYGKTPDNQVDHWYQFTFDGTTGATARPGGDVVTLHFVDGQRGDDGLRVDGRIVDPGGPGRPAGCQVTGDTNGDCVVDIDDLNNVRNHFGAAPGFESNAVDAQVAALTTYGFAVSTSKRVTRAGAGILPSTVAHRETQWAASVDAIFVETRSKEREDPRRQSSRGHEPESSWRELWDESIAASISAMETRPD